MKKDKLHLDKFEVGQIIGVKIAREYKNGRWNNYAPQDDYIVDSITNKSVRLHLKSNKLNKIEITDESIQKGIIRLSHPKKAL